MSDITIDAPRNARALVVLIHGHEADKDWGFLPWLSEYLCNAGFAVARFTYKEPSEVLGVVREIQSRFRGLPHFLLGHSLGGAIAIVVASDLDPAGVITLSAISRDEVLDAVEALDIPLLAIHGTKDASVPVDDAHKIVARSRDASLMLIDGASHTYNAIHPLVYVPRALEYAALLAAQFISVYA